MKDFYIFKNNRKQQPNHPDYIVSAKDDSGAFIEIGGAWLKDGAKGKHFSCRLQNEYNGQNKEGQPYKKHGFSIFADIKKEGAVPLDPSVEYPENENEGDIPF